MDTWKAHDGQVLKLMPLDSHYLLSSSADRTIVQWDMRFSPPQPHRVFKGHADAVVGMAIFGNDIISAGGHKLGCFSLFDSGEPPGSVVKTDTHRLNQSKTNITSLDVLKYHQMLVIGGEDGSVRICY
jgi:WD40 repeat protein